MPFAAMPETAIHKDRNLRGAKYEIGPARHRRMPAPSAHPFLAKQMHQHEFSRFVSATSHRPHDIRTFRFAECVGHA
jgi:hypothetical protein